MAYKNKKAATTRDWLSIQKKKRKKKQDKTIGRTILAKHSVSSTFFFLLSFNICCQTVGFLHLIEFKKGKRSRRRDGTTETQQYKDLPLPNNWESHLLSSKWGKKKYNVFQDYLIGTKEKLGIRFRSRIYFISSFFKLVEDMN